MPSDSDLAAALIIALAVLAIAACVWPGFARARARDLAGYWADAGGALYEIRPGPGGRAFAAQRARGAGSLPPAPQRGRLVGVRGVELAGGPGPTKGQLDFGGRRISWKGGFGAWSRQGVR